MRLLVRLVGLLILATAFAALIVDGTTSVAAGKVVLHPLGETLARAAPDGFERVKALVSAKMPVLWDPVLSSLLLLPTWVVLGVAGLAVLAITRRPRARAGYSRR